MAFYLFAKLLNKLKGVVWFGLSLLFFLFLKTEREEDYERSD